MATVHFLFAGGRVLLLKKDFSADQRLLWDVCNCKKAGQRLFIVIIIFIIIIIFYFLLP